MNNVTDVINFAIAVSSLTIAIIGLAMTFYLHVEAKLKSIYLIFFGLLVMYALSDLIANISLVMLGPGYAALSRYAIFAESFFSSLLMPVLTYLILYFSGDLGQRHLLPVIVWVLWAGYAGLLIYTQFTDSIYFVTDDNVYYRGDNYWLLLIPVILLALANLIGLLNRRKRLETSQLISILVYLMVPFISIVIQAFFYGILSIVLGTFLATLFMIVFIISRENNKMIRLSEENAHQQAAITVLKMRPHFVFNTLSSIYYLCDSDPRKAQQVIGDFTSYLRYNFNALAQNDLIPFSEELAHTRAYLSVESARFENLLFVEYHTMHTNFRLPPLTMQPIVENAVKHGVDPDSKPLTIRINTRLGNNSSFVTIEDDGPGFSAPNPSDEQGLHIGLNNVRDRLQLMCRGSIDISPRRGGGTIVTIEVPCRIDT